MTQDQQPISPLRQRMIEDMNMRKIAPKTQSHYIRAVKNLNRFWGAHPIPPQQKTCAANSYTWSMPVSPASQ